MQLIDRRIRAQGRLGPDRQRDGLAMGRVLEPGQTGGESERIGDITPGCCVTIKAL